MCKALHAAYGVGAEHQGTVPIPPGCRVGKELNAAKLLAAQARLAHAAFDGITQLNAGTGLLLDPDEFYAWLRRERPDAVISDTWDPALLAATVERLPLRRRPRIVSLNYPGPGAACGIDQRAEEIGRTAINILASLLTRGERGIPDSAHSTLVEGRWQAGNPMSGRDVQPRQPRA